jgi:hypothetical protein
MVYIKLGRRLFAAHKKYRWISRATVHQRAYAIRFLAFSVHCVNDFHRHEASHTNTQENTVGEYKQTTNDNIRHTTIYKALHRGHTLPAINHNAFDVDIHRCGRACTSEPRPAIILINSRMVK